MRNFYQQAGFEELTLGNIAKRDEMPIHVAEIGVETLLELFSKHDDFAIGILPILVTIQKFMLSHSDVLDAVKLGLRECGYRDADINFFQEHKEQKLPSRVTLDFMAALILRIADTLRVVEISLNHEVDRELNRRDLKPSDLYAALDEIRKSHGQK